MDKEEEYSPGTENYVWRVLVMSCGFFGLFFAFNTAQALATSLINDIPGLAYVVRACSLNLNLTVHQCLALLYFVFTISSVVSPKIVALLGPRLSMVR